MQEKLPTEKLIPLKTRVYEKCLEIVDQRLAEARRTLKQINEDYQTDTKSSAGDKFETGRAMMDQEREKVNRMLENYLSYKATLDRLDPGTLHQQVTIGSLVVTSRQILFLGVSLGQLKVDDQQIICVSLSAPLAQALKGQTAGDSVSFQNNTDQILQIT